VDEEGLSLGKLTSVSFFFFSAEEIE
jgi:hypothetical protein